MKEDFNKAQYYKKSIERCSKYNEEEARNFFSSIKYGTVVISYPTMLEEEIYKKLALILNTQYPKYCDEKDIVATLSSYGKIYTAQIRKDLGSALYHINSSNILIYSFLNKLDENIVHELIHKLGFLKFNNDFYNMPKIYLEAGTELMTNTVLNKPDCRELLLGELWTKSVGVQPRYLIETSLVNQLNIACGESSLERSLLDGKNYFETEVKNLIGEEEYAVISSMIIDICRLEKRYWKNQNKILEKNIIEKINEYQDMILHSIFDRKIASVKDEATAKNVLQELMLFSDYRVKDKMKDDKFKEYFEFEKKKLEGKFKTFFEIDDISDTWAIRYPAIKLEKTSNESEKIKIDFMAENFKKDQKGFFSRIFRPKSKIIDANVEGKLPSPMNVKCDINNLEVFGNSGSIESEKNSKDLEK